MTQFALLTGTFAQRGAAVVLKCLPNGAEVELEPEPDNPWDGEAVRVWLGSCQTIAVALHEREEELAYYGLTSAEVMQAPRWPLGHIAASEGKPIYRARKRGLVLVGTKELKGKGTMKGRLNFVDDLVLVEVEDGR